MENEEEREIPRRALIDAAKEAIAVLTSYEQSLLYDELAQHCPRFDDATEAAQTDK